MDPQPQTLSLLLIDIDNLKFGNDTFGHDFGDRLLVQIAERLKQAACPLSIVGRFLGNEFALVPPLAEGREHAVTLVNRIKQQMSELFVMDGAEVVITVSIGVVVFPDDGEDADTLLRNAEAAMYEAQRQDETRLSGIRPTSISCTVIA